jgi:hypothetical protein
VWEIVDEMKIPEENSGLGLCASARIKMDDPIDVAVFAGGRLAAKLSNDSN